jgi:hypothetical protein
VKKSEGRFLEKIPEKRTLILLSLNQEFNEPIIRKLFRVFGKIRRVFVQDISKLRKKNKKGNNK